MEILRTLFAWFDLPWREITFDNMFEKAKMLKKIDKEAIRFSKYVPLGKAGANDQEGTKEFYMSKLQERISKKKDRTALGGNTGDQAAVKAEFLERKMTKIARAGSPNRTD